MMKGSYILIINLHSSRIIKVGSLGEIYFTAGQYAYVGSAMGGFKSRLPHHFRKEKKPHWHIDYLLEKAQIDCVIISESDIRNECNIAEALMKEFDCIMGFGSSDCKCNSHLFNLKRGKYTESGTAELLKANSSLSKIVYNPFKL